MKTRLIGTERIGQDKGIAPVILGSRHTVTIPEAVELLRIQRKDVEAAFEQPFDNRAPRHFDGHGDLLRLARRHGPQPARQPGETGPVMVDGSLTHAATVAVEHTDLMLLGTPINAHKPLVRHDMIVLLWMYGGLHDKAHGSLTSLARSSLCGALPWLLLGPVLALAAQLPTGCAPRDPRWGTSPTEGLEAQGAYGTPSEVTRYDHCNRRSLGWYRGAHPRRLVVAAISAHYSRST